MREAAYMFIHTNGKANKFTLAKMESSKEAFLFIAGTGLDILIQNFGISYDPDNIRHLFYERFHVKT